MEEDKENTIIKKILAQGSEKKAPYDMSERVLSAWKTQQSTAHTYGPLIPVWFWWVLGIFMSGLLFWIFSSAPISSGTSITQTLINRSLVHFQFDLLNLNPVMITALGVLGIMLFINSFILQMRYNQIEA